ncbi:MAG: hypothetical protein WBG86_11325 [Polyangiales bacterium]
MARILVVGLVFLMAGCGDAAPRIVTDACIDGEGFCPGYGYCDDAAKCIEERSGTYCVAGRCTDEEPECTTDVSCIWSQIGRFCDGGVCTFEEPECTRACDEGERCIWSNRTDVNLEIDRRRYFGPREAG